MTSERPFPLLDEAALRYRWERPIFVATVLLNLALVVVALMAVKVGSEWVETHPYIAGRLEELRVLAIVAILALPGIIVIRHGRRALVKGNSLRLSRDQFPGIYKILEQQSAELGMTEVPELFLSEDDRYGDAHGFSVGRRNYIALSTDYVESDPARRSNVLAFVIGSELGRIRLGQTRWWVELLVAYILKMPYLKNPLLKARTYSRDRYGAFLAPDPAVGLIVHVSGRRALDQVNVEDFLRQSRAFGGFWAGVSALGEERPHIADRIQELDDAGLLKSRVHPG